MNKQKLTEFTYFLGGYFIGVYVSIPKDRWWYWLLPVLPFLGMIFMLYILNKKVERQTEIKEFQK